MKKEHSLTLTVKDIIRSSPVILSETESIAEVAAHLGDKDVGAVLLIDMSRQLSGIFTEKDLARALKFDFKLNQPIAAVMSKKPTTVDVKTSLEECARKMQSLNCKHLPVMDGAALVGLVEILDIQAAISEQLKGHVQELQRAQARIKQRDEYLGIVAHDIRSPLSVVTICCEMLELLRNDQPLGYDEIELVSRIKYNTERALALVHDLLDIGRLHAGAKLNFEEVEVAAYLEPIVENLRFSANEKEIKIACDLDSSLKARLDRERYGEIIINLIQNAIKFSPKNSTVTVKAELGTQKDVPDGFLRVSVTDQGPGIPQDKMQEIFGQYKQLDSESKTLGFGLGLSIANQFTRLHEGKIEVKSEAGKGATFTIVTPFAKTFFRIN